MNDQVSGYQDVLTGSREGPATTDAAAVPSVSAPELRSLLGVVVAVVAVAALYLGKEVLIPITLAVLLSFVLSPVVNALHRLRLWRAPAVMLAVLLALGVLGLLATLIGSQVASLASDAPRYAQTIEGKVQGVQGFAVAKLASVTRRPSWSTSANGPPIRAPASGARAGAAPPPGWAVQAASGRRRASARRRHAFMARPAMIC